MFPYIGENDVIFDSDSDRYGNDFVRAYIDLNTSTDVLRTIDKLAKQAGAVLHESGNHTAREYRLDYVIPAKSLKSFYFHIPVGYAIANGTQVPLFIKIRISDHEETEEIFIGTEDEGDYQIRNVAAISYDDEYLGFLTANEEVIAEGNLFNIKNISSIEKIKFEDVFLDDLYWVSPEDLIEEDSVINLLRDNSFWKTSSRENIDDEVYEAIEEAEREFESRKEIFLEQIRDEEYELHNAIKILLSRANEASDFLDDISKSIKNDIKKVVKDVDFILEHNGLDVEYSDIEDIIIDYK